MKYYFKWRYAIAVFTTSTRHYTLATVIKSASLEKARKSLDLKVRRYLERHPEAREHHRRINHEIIRRYDINWGLLRQLRKDVRGFSLDGE